MTAPTATSPTQPAREVIPERTTAECTGAYDCPGPHSGGCYGETPTTRDYARDRFAPVQRVPWSDACARRHDHAGCVMPDVETCGCPCHHAPPAAPSEDWFLPDRDVVRLLDLLHGPSTPEARQTARHVLASHVVAFAAALDPEGALRDTPTDGTFRPHRRLLRALLPAARLYRDHRAPEEADRG